MIDDSYGLYDGDNNDDHMIIFHSIRMTDRNLLFILISTLLTSYRYCTFQALQQVLCLKVGDTNCLR